MISCEICGRAPSTRRISYNGMAGEIAACNKKMHDLDPISRQKAKDSLVGKRRAHKILTARNPFEAGDAPTIRSFIESTFKKVKFAMTRKERKMGSALGRRVAK